MNINKHHYKIRRIAREMERMDQFTGLSQNRYTWQAWRPSGIPIKVDNYELNTLINDTVENYAKKRLKELEQELDECMINIGGITNT